MDEYFNADNPNTKKDLHKRIDEQVLNHIHFTLSEYKKGLKRKATKLDKKIKLDEAAARTWEQKEKIRINSKAAKELFKLNKELSEYEEKENKLAQLSNSNERPFFLWHLFFQEVFDDGGFDIVTGNPPYVQLQKMKKETDILQAEGFKTFARTGDLYCLFYEHGLNILKQNGVLSYITSNTWMRTKFGESIREYFVTNSNPITLLNFEDTQIFPSATVEVNILLTKNEPWDGKMDAVAIKNDFKITTPIQLYLDKNKIELSDLSKESWVILSKEDFKIKNRISNNAVQLKEWDIEINRGFLTGLNDAFFIDEEKKIELIKEDSNSDFIIKPLVRGREINKYSYDFNNKYVIFPHNGTKSKPRIEVEKDYPSIYAHLSKWKDKNAESVKLNNKGVVQTLIDRADQGLHWTNLRNCAYIDSFESEKLIWLSISDKPAFSLDIKKTYVTAPAYIMTSKCNKFLMVTLNSKVMEWYLDKVSSSTGVGTNQWSKIFVEQLPIPMLNEYDIRPFNVIADYLIYLNNPESKELLTVESNNHIGDFFEKVANMMVFELYFSEEMKQQKVNVLELINFKDISQKEELEKSDFIIEVYKGLMRKENEIRNRILVSESRCEFIRVINKFSN